MRDLLERAKSRIIDGIPESSLVLYCPGLQGRGGTLLDRSTHANHGTITGATWVRLPSGLMVLKFAGATHIVNCDDDVSLDITGAFTLEAWVKPATAPGNIQMLLGRDDGINRNYYMILAADGTLQVIKFTSNTATVGNSIGAYTPNIWIYCVGEYSLSNLTTFRNAVPNALTSATGAVDNDNVSFTMGCRATALDRDFAGYMALCRVYSRALTAAEVLRHFTRERHLFGV